MSPAILLIGLGGQEVTTHATHPFGLDSGSPRASNFWSERD